MVELTAQTPCAGLLPVSVGTVQATEVHLGVMTSLSPLGDVSALQAALQDAHGIALPKPGRTSGQAGAQCIWFGRHEWLLVGPPPDDSLGKHAAVVDQSDGWACVTLSGPGAVDVLARLVPMDLRQTTFKTGHTARTMVQHMTASITCTGTDTFMILVFRSMAGTLVHDLKAAMEAVAARG